MGFSTGDAVGEGESGFGVAAAVVWVSRITSKVPKHNTYADVEVWGDGGEEGEKRTKFGTLDDGRVCGIATPPSQSHTHIQRRGRRTGF